MPSNRVSMTCPPPRQRLRPTGRRRHRPARPHATTTRNDNTCWTADRRRARHRLARPDPPAHPPRRARRRPHPTRTEPSDASAGRTTTRVKPRPFAFRWWSPTGSPTGCARPEPHKEDTRRTADQPQGGRTSNWPPAGTADPTQRRNTWVGGGCDAGSGTGRRTPSRGGADGEA